MSILFLGSGPFGIPTLERLAVAQDELFVATVPSARRGRRGELVPTVVMDKAVQLGLPCEEVETLKKGEGLRLLEATGAGIVIVADFRLILPESFLTAPPRRCYNLHGSLLPRWRGAAPVARAILDGDQVFGVTLYQMVRELDAGPIVAREEFRPEQKWDTAKVEEHLSKMAADLLSEWLPVLTEGEVPLQIQDDSLVTQAPRLKKEEGWVDWTVAPGAVEDQVLALKPWPRTFSRWRSEEKGREELLFIDRVEAVIEEAPPVVPGTIRDVGEQGVSVACGAQGRGTVLLKELMRIGKRSMPAREFLRGTPMRPGDVFLSAIIEKT